jgi:hypothetical protein
MFFLNTFTVWRKNLESVNIGIKLKRNWALPNGYKFLEIRYDEDIEVKLTTALKEKFGMWVD